MCFVLCMWQLKQFSFVTFIHTYTYACAHRHRHTHAHTRALTRKLQIGKASVASMGVLACPNVAGGSGGEAL